MFEDDERDNLEEGGGRGGSLGGDIMSTMMMMNMMGGGGRGADMEDGWIMRWMRCVMMLVMVIPKIIKVMKSTWRFLSRFRRLLYKRSERFVTLRTLNGECVQSVTGSRESYRIPRAFRALMLRMRDRFLNPGADEEDNDAYALVDTLMYDSEMVLLKDPDSQTLFRVGPGLYTRAWKTEEYRESTTPITKISFHIELVADTQHVDDGVAPARTHQGDQEDQGDQGRPREGSVHKRRDLFRKAALFLEECVETLNLTEQEELKKPHVFDMIKGDRVETCGMNGRGATSDDEDEYDDGSQSDDEDRYKRKTKKYKANKDMSGGGGLLKARRCEPAYEIKCIAREESKVEEKDNPSFPEKEELFATVEHFLNSKEEFDKRRLNYNLNVALVGYPGCGKTRFFQDLAIKHNLILIHVNCDMVRTEETLRELFFSDYISGYFVPHNRRLYVFEDIDSSVWGEVVRDRKRFGHCRRTDVFGLDVLLRVIDGIIPRTGHIVFYTTNMDINTFDPAFVRPGRIDKIVHASRMNSYGIAELYRNWFNDDLPSHIERGIESDRLSIAEIVSIFRSFDKRLICEKLAEVFGVAFDSKDMRDASQSPCRPPDTPSICSSSSTEDEIELQRQGPSQEQSQEQSHDLLQKRVPTSYPILLSFTFRSGEEEEEKNNRSGKAGHQQ